MSNNKQVEAYFNEDTGMIDYREVDIDWSLTYSKPKVWIDAPSFQWDSEKERKEFFTRQRQELCYLSKVEKR